jgi:preprotein translocase subunit SecG
LSAGAAPADVAFMLFVSSLMIAVAAVLLTQVAHRRAKGRSSSYRRESAYLLFAPLGLLVAGFVVAFAVGASKVLAAFFFLAAFGLALVWTARWARVDSRH